MSTLSEMVYSSIEKIQAHYDPEVRISKLADHDIQRQWRAFQSGANNEWRRINSPGEVRKRIAVLENTVNSIETGVPFGSLTEQDEYDMAIALYSAIQGLRKIAVSQDTISNLRTKEFSSITQSDVVEMTEQIISTEKRMLKILYKRAMQD